MSSKNANCKLQDKTELVTISLANCHKEEETSVLMSSNTEFCSMDEDPSDILEFTEDDLEQHMDNINVVENHGCHLDDCMFCENALIYISGYLPFSLLKFIKCDDCISKYLDITASTPSPIVKLCFQTLTKDVAFKVIFFSIIGSLRDSAVDPCPDKSFLLLKNYMKFDQLDPKIAEKNKHKGLFIPSGSLSTLIFHAEKIYRNFSVYKLAKKWNPKKKCYELVDTHCSQINDSQALDRLTNLAIKRLPPNVLGDPETKLFPLLQESKHYLETSFGVDDHFYSIIRLILKKFFVMRIKKSLNDRSLDKGSGNFLMRLRAFQGK